MTLGTGDNNKYNSLTTGRKQQLLARIANQSNWVTSLTDRYDVHNIPPFTVIMNSTSTSTLDDVDMISDSGLIAIVWVCILVAMGVVWEKIVACKKKKLSGQPEKHEDDELKL